MIHPVNDYMTNNDSYIMTPSIEQPFQTCLEEIFMQYELIILENDLSSARFVIFLDSSD